MVDTPIRIDDAVVDSTAFFTSVILIVWSFYTVIVPVDRVLDNMFVHTSTTRGLLLSVLSLNLIVSAWIIVREILDKRFIRSGYKFILLGHMVVVVFALVWILRSQDRRYREWCLATYKLLFGFLFATSLLYTLLIMTVGPASIIVVQRLRLIYNRTEKPPKHVRPNKRT